MVPKVKDLFLESVWRHPPGVVLVAEEFSSIAEAIRRECQNSFSLTVVTSRCDLLEKAAARKPDVIVLGSRLAEQSGVDIFRKVRTNGELRDAILILGISTGNAETLRNALEIFVDHITDCSRMKKHLKRYLLSALRLQTFEHLALQSEQSPLPENGDTREDGHEAPEQPNLCYDYLNQIKRCAALASKEAVEVMQAMILFAGSHQVRPLKSETDWRRFHTQCLAQILQGNVRLQKSLNDLKQSCGMNRLTESEYRKLIQSCG